jgi:hypothetical protein
VSVTIPASLVSSTYRPATKASAKEHAKSAREVVRASARCSQRGVTRTDSDECVGHIDGRNLHDALHHLRHGERGKPVVPMPPLLLDHEQSRRAQLREMTASCCGVIPATDANSEAVSARPSIRAWSIAARVASKPETQLAQSGQCWPWNDLVYLGSKATETSGPLRPIQSSPNISRHSADP